MPLLEAIGLEASYGGHRVLSGIDLHLSAGEAVGLSGPNKAGKSTVCACLAGLKRLDRGVVRFGTEDVSNLGAKGRRERGLRLCPEGRGVFGTLTVSENLKLAAGSADRAATDSARLLESIPELQPLLTREASLLSGGEARLLSIAMRVLGKPRLLILDEPSLGLAPIAVRRVLDLVRMLRRDEGMAVLIVEERLSWLRHEVDRAVVVSNGVVVAEGLVATLENDVAVQEAFLGELDVHQPEKVLSC